MCSGKHAQVVFTGTAEKKYDGDKVVLYNNKTKDHDSAYINNGRFVISVPFKEPTHYMFYSKFEMKKKGGYSPFGILVTKPCVVHIDADIEHFSTSKISGSKEQAIYFKFATENNKAQQAIMDQLSKKYGEAFLKKPDEKGERYRNKK